MKQQKQLEKNDIYASWAGGKDGREVVDKLFPLVQLYLSPNGVFYLIALEENKPSEICEILSRKEFGSFKSCKVGEHNKRGEHLYVLKFWK